MFSKHWDKVNDDDKVESTSFFFFSIWLFIFDQEMSSRSKKKLDLSRTHMGSLNCCFEIFSYEFDCMINFNWFFDVSFYVISRAAALVCANKREKREDRHDFQLSNRQWCIHDEKNLFVNMNWLTNCLIVISIIWITSSAWDHNFILKEWWGINK